MARASVPWRPGSAWRRCSWPSWCWWSAPWWSSASCSSGAPGRGRTARLHEDLHEQRQDIERREHRITEREQRLDDERRALEERERAVAALDEEVRLEEERRSSGWPGLTADEARTELVESIEHDAKRTGALLARDIERAAEEEAEGRAKRVLATRHPAARLRADRRDRRDVGAAARPTT